MHESQVQGSLSAITPPPRGQAERRPPGRPRRLPLWGRWLAGLGCVLFALPAQGAEGDSWVDDDEAADEREHTGPAADTIERLERTIRVIQRRPIVKSGRFELNLGGGLGAGDQMYRHYLTQASGRVHVSEWVSIGGTYAHYFTEESRLFREVTQDFEVFPEISRIQWYAGADISVVALDGKLVLFGATIAYFDLYASIGGGVTTTSRSSSPKPTGMIGVGLRLFFAEWLAVTFELRNHIFIESFNAGNELVNNVIGQAGLSFYIPFGFDYRYPR